MISSNENPEAPKELNKTDMEVTHKDNLDLEVPKELVKTDTEVPHKMTL